MKLMKNMKHCIKETFCICLSVSEGLFYAKWSCDSAEGSFLIAAVENKHSASVLSAFVVAQHLGGYVTPTLYKGAAE